VCVCNACVLFFRRRQLRIAALISILERIVRARLPRAQHFFRFLSEQGPLLVFVFVAILFPAAAAAPLSDGGGVRGRVANVHQVDGRSGRLRRWSLRLLPLLASRHLLDRTCCCSGRPSAVKIRRRALCGQDQLVVHRGLRVPALHLAMLLLLQHGGLQRERVF